MTVLLVLIAVVLAALGFWCWKGLVPTPHPVTVEASPATTAPPRPLVDQIDDLLPQTQCGQCGFGGCRPYAESLAIGESDINRCPPGGDRGIAALAKLLDRPIIALDPECGEEKPLHLAFIREAECIGCTKCIQVCPVDAIVGAPKLMHTVIADLCTGCELCIPPCPVDCIDLVPTSRF